MALKKRGTLRPLVLGTGSILLIVLLAGGLSLAFALHGSPRAFAASLQKAAGTTCAQAPSVEYCTHQDPEMQGCAADAQTVTQADIEENGFVIGSVERRWSAKCQSWWGRVIDNRPGSQANILIAIAGTTLSAPPTFVSDASRILYSLMMFDATPTQLVPSITGTLEIDAIITSPSATLPAIDIPGTPQ
jgi:hypothetical protein